MKLRSLWLAALLALLVVPAWGSDGSGAGAGPTRVSGDPAVDGVWLPDTLPSHGCCSRAVVDSVGDQLLVFSGRLWSIPLDGSRPASPMITTGLPPASKVDPAILYDADLDRVLMFGGRGPGPHGFLAWQDSLFELRLRPQAEWRPISVIGPGPHGSIETVTALDRARRRLLYLEPSSDDVWALDLGTLRWQRLATVGPGPVAELQPTTFAVVDDARNRLIIGDSRSDTTWTLSLTGTPTWSRVTHGGARPPRRIWSAVVADPVRQRLILLGLIDSTQQAVASAFALDYATLTWSEFPAIPDRAPASTPGITVGGRQPGVAVDAKRGVLWMTGLGEHGDGVWSAPTSGDEPWTRRFGRGIDPRGRTGPFWIDTTTNRAYMMADLDPYSDWSSLWSLPLDGDPATRFYWSVEELPSGVSPLRANPAWAFDSRRRSLLVFSGDPPEGGRLSDLHRFDLATRSWQKLAPTGATPVGNVAVYDAATDRMYLYDEYFGGGTLYWLALSSSPPQWNAVPVSQTPDLRSGISLALDTRRGRLCVFGWASASASEVWTLDPLASPPTWSRLETTGTPPDGRWNSVLVYDPIADRLLIHGGRVSGGTRGDLWALSLSGTPTWTELHPDHLPHGRGGHTAVYDAAHDRMLMYGVEGDLSVLQWHREAPLPPPPPPTASRLQLEVLSNPALAGVSMAVVLADQGDVRVDVMDLAGRVTFTHVVPAMSAGPHVFTLAHGLRSGIYWVRVRQGAHQASARAVIVR